MGGLPAVPPIAPDARRLRRLRIALALLAAFFLLPFLYLLVASLRVPPAPVLALAATLALAGPPLLALARVLKDAAPVGLRLASAVALAGLVGAGLALPLAVADASRAGWIVALAGVVSALAWVVSREATALREGLGGDERWRRSWSWTRVRVLAYYALNVMVLGCGSLLALKDPRNANDAHALGDVRTVVSAQAAYQSANDGHYDGRLVCLADPYSGCIPGYPAAAPTFLDLSIASLETRGGYARQFVPGPPPKTLDPKRASPTSVTGYSYSATPARYGETGYRSFIADETGAIHFTRENRPARPTDPVVD